MKRILLVDDDPVTRLPLEVFLSKDYQVFCAGNGLEAIELFAEHDPDLVLMDIDMPGMDGFEATQRIKAALPSGRMVPVVFFTGEERDAELARCLACGGDDFINKPFRPIILTARINAWLERAALAEREARDRRAIETVLSTMRETLRFDGSSLRMLTTPLEKTSGDVVLSARSVGGLHHVMVGDFTGHGLAAAIGGPLITDVFYTMTAKGLTLEEIVTECGYKVFDRLPTSMFLAFCFVEWDRRHGRARIWNGGLPAVLLYRGGSKLLEVPSHEIPLGIRREPSDFSTITTLTMEATDRLFVYSDGIVEAMNENAEMFGQERLEQAIAAMLAHDGGLEEVEQRVRAFCGGQSLGDDVTMVEIS